jgi:hypothetical protein
MTRMSDERAVELLRERLPAPAHEDPDRDLWPLLRSRIEAGNRTAPAADWILAIALLVLCLIRPSLTAILLIHF